MNAAEKNSWGLARRYFLLWKIAGKATKFLFIIYSMAAIFRHAPTCRRL
jgi:hypothetical protein